MKKIFSFTIAIVLTFIVICGGKNLIIKSILSNSDKLILANNENRNSLDFLMDKIIKDNSMVVLGSSELMHYDCINCSAHPMYLYNNPSNYNIIQVGRGYTQSLFHAISVGALSNNIKNNKVVMILSPQWFTSSGINSDSFSSRFSERMYVEFVKNNNISKDTKTRVADRVEELLSADEIEKKRIIDMNSLYIKNNLNLLSHIKYKIYNSFMDLKEAYMFNKNMKDYYFDINFSNDKLDVDTIDYSKMLDEAELVGEKECTNNDYGIYNEYYDLYIRDVYDMKKNSSIYESYVTSPEYDDLKLFLDVCKDLKLDVMLISIPVNGKWYDYTGFSKNDRDQYYENIRKISKEYNVKLADFSDKEYEMYFLRDIMHLGWKGWVYVDEAIYKFYKGQF